MECLVNYTIIFPATSANMFKACKHSAYITATAFKGLIIRVTLESLFKEGIVVRFKEDVQMRKKVINFH